MKKSTLLILTILIILSITSTVFGTDVTPPTSNLATINSSEYIVSKENMLISRVQPKTSINEFKNKFDVENLTVHVFDKDGKNELEQGYIGTGMQIKFDNHEITYIVSVIGDITGNGEIKQVEVSKAIKHVVGLEKSQLTGVQAVSADVSGDGIITQKDVSILIKYVVYGKLDIEELTKPQAPILEFVNGTEGENGWYTSNVTLKINEPENSPVPITKMSCEITSNNKKQEKIVEDGENIVIEEEGIYEINCYSITQTGVKSNPTTRKIKIDKTNPISANLIGSYNDENGASYQFDTTTNHSVYLKTDEGEDDVSQIAEITLEATGAQVIPKGTKAPVLIENNGTTQVTVTTKNNAGLETTKNYTIIIDKVIKNPGTVVTKINNQDGEIYKSENWTNQNIYVQVQNGDQNITTTYTVEGANTVAQTGEPTVLTNPGISTITVINTDDAGNTIKEEIVIKIDKQAPQKPTLEITGEKIINSSEWFTSDVQIKVTEVEKQTGAMVDHLEYTLKKKDSENPVQGTMQSGQILLIEEEGIYELEVLAVDEAGNKSEKVVETIKLDKTNPVAGTMNLYTNNQNGQIYVNNTWTNQNVYIELVEGTDKLSGHTSTVYEISGQVKKEASTEPSILTQQGVYTITVTTIDVSGRTSQREYTVNIDKQKPEAPEFEIKEGSKTDPRNEWYNSNVTVEVLQAKIDQGGSGVSYTTYEVTGSAQIAESIINDHGTIQAIQDGIYNITAYTYDLAGNKSEGTTITIKTDKTAPQNLTITPNNVKGTSFNLSISADEQTSGIVLYQVYVDGGLYKEIQKGESQVECEVINQSSGVHNVSVIVKDLAGNEATSQIDVNMGRLETEDIERIEFVVNNFTQTKNGQTVNTGADFIISDTSVSEITKYIQVGSSNTGTIGELTGSIRVVRKDGSIVEKLEYYPENLLIEIAQYTDGSGSTVKHNANINVTNTLINNTNTVEGTTKNASINIMDKQNTDNIFSVSDEKVTGTKTYTRLIIKQITKDGQKIPFRITSNVL